MAETNPHRLPRTVLPRRYDLRLAPDLEAATFAGTVAIEVEVQEPTAEVVLNAIELEVDEAWLEVGGARRDVTVTLDEEHERATLAVDGGPLAAGPAIVHLAFRGILNDKLRGFYRSTFTDDDGTDRVIATTQFEATDARRAFPCWDEPDLKATFAITLDVPEDLFAVSNAAEAGREPIEDGRHRVTFAESMLMSTYLVAFVVGPLEATDPIDVDGVPLRIVHRAGQADLTAFALESGAFALRYFTEYFGVPYPADKLDLVAVPDFAFGAMENLGCVTFRDALLIVDPERSTQSELQRVADVIHHEIAHMWFGDLVTMAWWEGIWLNEAFATFMEMRCTDAFRPEWDRWTDFGISRTAAYDTDALTTTRPIEFEVVSPADAEGMFDVLTYEKGAAVVRMLEQYLGEDRFRDGIRLYISRHAHGNTVTTDLWDAIEEATGEPVRRIMDSWIFQGGHPELAVTVEPEGETATLRLTQQRFLYDTGDGSGDDATRWVVPVLVRWAPGAEATTSSVTLERVLVEGTTAEVTLATPPAWVITNSGGSGFFRVRYDAAGLAAAARAPGISAVERYALIDDAWASLLAGTIGIGEVLELLRGYADETDLSVWQRVLGVVSALDRLVDDDTRPHLQTWVRAFAGPALRRVGLDPVAGEPDRTAALRGALVTALGTTGADPETRARAQALLARADEGEEVDTDLFDAALRVLAAEGGAERFAAFRQRSATGATPQERLRYLGVLADFPGDAENDAFLAMCLTDDVRTQDAPFVIRRAIANRTQARRTWDFLTAHWDEALARFPSNSISRLLEGIRSVTDPALAHAVEGFLAEHPVPQGDKPIAQHRERMRAGVALRGRVAGDLASALKDGPS
ncbi:M1 family metallopeptidase [Iamia sp. SCSIO 61187]|uniref:M1 family metallopeptidase n=1 Tax=Iamia sp. SCSIO 61187 TaxID=2722752 RepID=UPI001C629D61|nr:M1 family metallopeptidase [Iamia sp. SCSIO 61187]QYG93863.1 M1 family metallopeptidase [Iamia sp. SCSIO 61187]